MNGYDVNENLGLKVLQKTKNKKTKELYERMSESISEIESKKAA